MSPTLQSTWDVPHKQKKCGQKTTVLHVSVVELEENVTSREIFRHVLVRTNTAHRRRSSKKKKSTPYEKKQIQPPGTTFSNLSDEIAGPEGHILFFHFANMHQTHSRARKGSKTRSRHLLRETPRESKTFETHKRHLRHTSFKLVVLNKKFACGGLYGACLNTFLERLSRYGLVYPLRVPHCRLLESA